MNCDTLQVVSLYESGMEIEEIYEAMEGQVAMVAIKMALVQGSSLYRERVKQKKEDYSEEDLDASHNVIRQLMYSADSDIVKLRAAIRIDDTKRGRLDVKNIRNVNFSMTLINQELNMSERAIEMAKTKKVVVEDRHKHLKEIAA